MKSALDSCSPALSEPENIFIQVAPVVGEYLFPNIFQTLIYQYPHIAISIENHMPLRIIENVKNTSSHLGILGIQYSLLDKLGLTAVLSNELTFMPLFQYKLSVAVSIQHPLAHYKSLSVKTLIKYPIVFQAATNNLTDDLNYQWLKLYGNPIIKSVVSSNNLYLECIKSGAAIGFFPSPKYSQLNITLDNAIKLIPLHEQNAQHIVGYLYNNTRPVTPAMQIIIDELQKYSVDNRFTSAK